MLRDNLNRQLKYSIRKKKNGGGAASFIVGSVIFGGLMLGNVMSVNADEVASSSTNGDTTVTSNQMNENKDISGKEVTLSKPNTVETTANQKEGASAVSSDNVVSTTTMNQNESGSTENSENPVDPTNEKQTANETTDTKSSGTDVKNDNLTQSPTNARNLVAAAATVPESQLANNKVTISNFKVNKHLIRESEGLDINFSFDWSGQGLVKGDTLVVPLSDAFTSITRQVPTPFFGSNGQQVGTMVLDYDAKKIYTTFTADMDPNKIYSGTINVGTFVNRNYFINKDNRDIVELYLPNGQKETVDLQIIFDAKDAAHELGIITVQADKNTDNPDGSTNITWDAIVNSDKKQMSDASIYITPDVIKGINPQFEVSSQVPGYNYSAWTDMNFEYDSNNTYSLNEDSFRVYQANVYASMGYAKEKELVKDKDYEIVKSDVMPHAYAINLIGDYATTSSPIVVEYSGTVPAKNGESAAIAATTDAFVAYYAGTIVVSNSAGTRYSGPFSANWAHASIDTNNSSIAGSFQNILGSVSVVHIDATTGKLLKPEAYVLEKDGTPLHNVKQGTEYKTTPETFTGYKFTTMGYDSAPAKGTVKEGHQRVIYLYVPETPTPEEKKGNVDVTYVTEDGKVLEATTDVVKDGEVGTDYTTEKKNFDGYSFSRMGEFSAEATGQVEEGTKHVVYVYTKNPEEKKGNVDVTYVTEDGKVLEATTDVVKDGEVGTDYTTEKKNFDGYSFSRMGEFSAEATGQVEEGTKHVVYVYTKNPEEKKGSVDVKYITKDGEVLEATTDVVKDGEVGTDYTTEEKSFTGYHFVGMDKKSDPATGVVSEGTKHVIYVYEKDVTPEEKKGNVDVTYVTEDGKVLEATTDVVKDGEVGTDYTTEKKNFDGYSFSRMGEFSAEATGQVEEGTKHVVYVYTKNPEEKKGSVDVKYITKDGEVLEATTDVVKDGEVGTDYTTEEKSFTGYHFVGMDKKSDPATGVVSEGTKHVIYVYEKDVTPEEKKGNVDVTYVTEDGKVLEATTDVVKDGEVGTDYTTEKKNFDGYSFSRMGEFSAEATGQVEEGTKHVVYVYTKNPEEKKGNVDVTYVTEDGKVLEATTDVVKDGEVGTDYTTEKKNFDGYSFSRMGEFSAEATGQVEEGTKHVVYVYTKNPEEKKGSVDVKYITKDGEVLEATTDVVKDGEVGTDYTTEEKSFTGYHFVGMDKKSDPATGVVSEGTKHVIYVYEKDVTPEEKKGNVDVTYVTEDGKVLEATTDVVKDGEVGTDYTTEKKNFDGYSFSRMGEFSAEATGQVEEGTKHVVYVYTKNPEEKKGSVDVKYITKDGEVLEATTDVVKDGEVGTDYTTEEKSFTGYHFVGMDKKSDPATGVVSEGTKHVIYVYEKDVTPEEKKGNVDVTYVTEDGKVLEATTDVVKDGEVGTDYTTEKKNFDGYSFSRMGEFSAEATGQVEEGTKHVVYVYTKNPEEKKGSVDVKYITKDGEVLEATTDVVKDGEVGTDYTTEEKSFTGYHFVGMDKKSDPATGVVSEGTKHVIYVYEKDVTPEEKKGNVDVTYVTEDGKVLEATTDVVKDGEVGTDYTTEKKNFDGYSFSRMGEFSAEATGQVEEGTKHVVYVYTKNPEEKKGNVDVTYITKDGEVLEATTDVVKDGEVGTDYTTEEKSFTGYHFVGMDKKSDPTIGVVSEGTKHVIYVYEKDVTPEEKKGNVDVKYITKDGEVLEATTDVVKDGEVGTDYTTEEKSFTGYHFVGMDKKSDPATGVVSEGTKHVIYVYEKDVTPEEKKGNVDVTYVTEDGKVLEATTDVVKDGEVGTDYTTEKKNFDGYSFSRMGEFSAEATGQVEEGTKHVVYVYTKNPEEKKGSVDVKYITKDGEVLEATTDVVKDGEVGTDYTTEEKSFTGYHFVGMDKKSDPATGVVSEGTKHVIYVYEKDVTPEEKKGNVDVTYVTEDGKVLEATTDVVKDGEVGTDYTTEKKNFDGYSFSRMGEFSAEATGQVEEGTKHVVYVYTKNPEEKKGNVDVTYVTEDGKVLEATTDVVKDGEVGTDYTTEKKNFDGYSFSRMGEFSAEATGQVEEGTKHVVYVYTKNPEEKKGSVDVKYITKDGEVLEATTDVVKDGEVGTDYTTEEKSFTGYHFVGMDKKSDPATGVVSEGTKHVIYVYEKDVTPEEKKGNVDVTYVTEDGKVLEATTDVVKDGEVGTDYTTEKKNFDGYSFSRMGEFSAEATGQVEEGTKHVVYVYTKNPEEKKGSVDVKYITKDGEVLEATTDVVKDGEVGTDYTTEEKSFTGYHFVGMDKKSDPATGVVSEGTKHVIYVYEKDVTPEEKKGNVDVTYVTEDGKVLEATTDVVKDGEVGTDYTTEKKNFDGYSFSRMGEFSAEATGQVEEGTKHVVYVYTKNPEEKKGNVDVTYITKDGEVLEATTDVVKDGEVGTDYTTEEKSFTGYHFVGMDKKSDPTIGVVSEGTKHVIYVYEKDVTPEEKKGNVDVKYITKDGEVLEATTDVVKDGEVGTDYTTEEKSFTGYHFVGMDKKSDPATGVVSEGTKHVIYVYEKDVTPEEKKGNVDVTYVTEDGKVLEATTDVVKDGEVGTDYTTEKKNFDGYSFSRMGEFSAEATGQVEEGTKHVVYVYTKNPEEKKGSVDVKYITKDGEVLEATTDVVKDGEVGTDYTTEEKSFTGYHFVGMDKKSDPATGVVSEGTKHVIYVYEKDVTPEEKKGNVDVTYVTEDGKVLEATTDVVKDGEVGTDYTTEKKNFDGYSFSRMGEFSAEATGQVEEGTKHVVYVYTKNPEEKKGSVDVKYITKDGEVLEATTDVVKDGEVGTDYTTEEKSFTGYHFVGMDKKSDPATGVVSEGTKHVIYVYEKDVTPEVKKGSVDVKYVTTDGKVLEDVTKVKDNAPVGEAYTTEEKSFDGYHFVGMDKTSDSANGKVTEGDKHVVYVYEKDVTPEVKKGSVDVKYVTTDGKVLEDVTKVKDNTPVGEAYTTEEKSFDGYHFVGMDKTSDSANGKVTEGDKHVVYVYEKDVTPEVKKGSVDVKYVTTDGKVLEDVTKVKDNAPVGEAYTTEEKSFDGYHFVGMDKTSDSANGKVTEGDKHVVYVYEKDVTPEVKKGSVDVKYVTTDGKVLEDVTKVKDNAPVGEAYTTEEKSFDGYHFVGMDKTSDSANGKVTEGDKHVVYVYEKDVTPEVKKGSVDVKYVTTDGKVLEDVTKVKDNAPVGEEYTTEEKSFDGYHFVGMDKTSDSANGKVTEGDKHVVYVYEKDPEVPTTPEEKKGSVYVKYVDENGNELPGGEKTIVIKNGKVGSYYFTTEKDFDGYKFSHMSEDSANATGKVIEGEQLVVYVYTKNNTPQPEPSEPEVPTTPEKPGTPQPEPSEPEVPTTPEKPGTPQPEPSEPEMPTTPEKPGTPQPEPSEPEVPTTPEKPGTPQPEPSEPEVPAPSEKPGTPQPEPSEPEVPAPSEKPETPQEESKDVTDVPTKTSTSKVNAEKVTVNKATVLPQTGDKKENNSSVMGLVSLGLAGLLGLGIKRKEEKDNH